MSSTFGKIFKVTTFGESHGGGLGCVIENVPAGLKISEEEIQIDLDKRKPGQNKLGTPRKESDKVEILSGVFEGKTIGSPIMLAVRNENAKDKDYSYFKYIYRPSHADFTYQEKYGYRSYRGGARASARTTIGIVAAGSIAKKILKEKTNVKILAYVSQVYDLKINTSFALADINSLKNIVSSNDIHCPDEKIAKQMSELILNIKQEKDSVGGVIDLIIDDVPVGLGDPVFERLDALLAQAMMAIPAVKGVEIGSGFSCASMKGSEHNDEFYIKENDIRTKTNFSGGIQGGISNGERIFMRIAFKPTATISKEQKTVNSHKEEVLLKVNGRHDPCVLPRAIPIVEAFASIVLADRYLVNQTSDINKFD